MTHHEFFDALVALSPLRVISISGPSVFEAICRLERFGIAGGHLNAITDAYHWHVDLARFRWLATRDTVHERSGRQVLFFELAEAPDTAPFLLIYVHRAKGEPFDAARADRFAALHAAWAAGVEVRS